MPIQKLESLNYGIVCGGETLPESERVAFMLLALQQATRHAEMEAIDVLLEQWQKNGVTKEEIALRFSKFTLYVTCEPYIMCAAALSMFGNGLQEVYYGCANDKFGACGSILSLHTSNSGKLHRFDSKILPFPFRENYFPPLYSFLGTIPMEPRTYTIPA